MATTAPPLDPTKGIGRVIGQLDWSSAGWIALLGACAWVIAAPFWTREFSYRDLVFARLGFAFLPLPILALLYAHSETVRSSMFRLWALLHRLFFKSGSGGPSSSFGAFQWILAGLACLVTLFAKQPDSIAAGHSQHIAEVFYATDRGELDPVDLGTGERGVVFDAEPGQPQTVHYGVGKTVMRWKADITLWQFPLSAGFRWTDGFTKPGNDSGFLGASDLSTEDFLSVLASAINDAPKRGVLLFVHGFRTTFPDAVVELTDLVADLKYKGVPVLFSWPAGNAILSYDHDYEHATEAETDLSTLLEQVNSVAPGEMNVLAHSMGSRVLGGALKQLQALKSLPRPFGNIIFAAPDVDQNTFYNFSPAVRAAAVRTTVYVSAWDLALRLSSMQHQGDRVGLRCTNWPGMDVIDTQGQDTSLVRRFGHAYIFDSQVVLYDLFTLINSGTGPGDRPGTVRSADNCWEFRHR